MMNTAQIMNQQIDREHVEQRQIKDCVVRLNFVIQKNNQVEEIILDSLLDSFDRRVTA